MRPPAAERPDQEAETMPLAQIFARSALAIAAVMLAPGCDPAFKMRGTITDGVIENTHETFVGTASEAWPNKPLLEIITNTGARCVGDVRTVSAQEGQGHLHCSDGRRGAFGIVSTGPSGAAGFGDLGGKRIGFVVK
jgi:hypothetical protein